MTIPSPRPRIGIALVVACALTVASATTAAAGVPVAHAASAKKCNVSAVSGKLGPTSVTSLTVTHATCSTGVSVVKAFHACRLVHGKTGRCVKKVKGYACREIRTNGPTQFSGAVTCKKGRASVAHRYTQVL